MATPISPNQFTPKSKFPSHHHKQQSHLFPLHHIPTILTKTYKPHKISCTKNPINNNSSSNDSLFYTELAQQISKVNTQNEQNQEAVEKSRALLFTELCQFLGLTNEELVIQWREMRDEEKWDLGNSFVSKWGFDFHPLSVKSVVEIVDEHLRQVEVDSVSVSGSQFQSVLFSGFRYLLGFQSPQK